MKQSFRFLIGLLVAILLMAVGLVWYFLSASMTIIQTDVLVYGASLGGASAAITAAENGADVVLLSETRHVGGQAVDAGLSAFDDLRSHSENFGIYRELKEFLREKYHSGSGSLVGLGRATVGSVASVPADIEEFFLHKIQSNPRIRYLTNFQILSLKREGKIITEAVVQSKGNSARRLRVQFRMILDGTQTGKLYPMAKVPYSVGFDSKEETGEPHAMSEQVRKIFIEGERDKDGIHGGFGNLVQPVGLPVPIFDKGYRGDFYPPLSFDRRCWNTSATGPRYIKDAQIISSADPACAIAMDLTVPFSDTYDVFVVYHGGDNSGINMDVRLGSNDQLNVQTHLNSSGSLAYVGSFPFLSNQSVTFTIHPWKGTLDFEGLVMSKRNIGISVPPQISLDHLEENFSIPEYSHTLTDIYVNLEHEIAGMDSINLIVNGSHVSAAKVGDSTYRTRQVLQRENVVALADPDSPDTSRIILVNLGVSFPGYSFDEINSNQPEDEAVLSQWQQQEHLKKKALWPLEVPTSGEYMLSIERPLETWVKVQLSEKNETAHILLEKSLSIPRLRSELGLPITVVHLEANKQYVLHAASTSEVLPTLHLFPLNSTDIIYRSGQEKISFHSEVSSVYDLWALANIGDTAEVTLPDRTYSVDISSNQEEVFSYLGKVFLDDSGDSVVQVKNGKEVRVIAIQDHAVDTHVIDDFSGASSFTLPSGRYRTYIFYDSRADEQKPVATVEGCSEGKFCSLSFLKMGNNSLVSTTFFFTDGRPIHITIDGIAPDRVAFIEDIPLLTDYAFKSELVLFPQQDVPVDFFGFRNIISPGNFSQEKIKKPFAQHIGNNTRGVTLLQFSRNDYAPVTEQSLDSSDLATKARERSYAFYYWLRYGMSQEKAVLGCDSANDIHCDSRRIYFADVLGEGDGMATVPYYREGRRIKTLRSIAEQDISAASIDCKVSTCDPNLCDIEHSLKNQCILRQQEPVLFRDAVAAVNYSLDFHVYLPLESFLSGKLSSFMQYMFSKGLTDNTSNNFMTERIASLPAEISLGSLIPINDSNLFPASTNFGVTQIASGYFRVHGIEIAVGTSIGHLIAYALQHDISPSDIWESDELTMQYQEYLLSKGMLLYPIQDVAVPSVLSDAVQYLILHRLLKPQATAIGTISIRYFVYGDKKVSESDEQLMKLITPDTTSPLTYQGLLRSVIANNTDLTDEQLVSAGKQLGIIDSAYITASTEVLLKRIVKKRDLYLAAYHQLRNSN